MTGIARDGFPHSLGQCSGTFRSPEVHVWLRSVECGDDEGADFELLDDVERARADRFCFERDRVRFVNRRAFMRQVLARYLETEPSEIRVHASERGRPVLEADTDIAFNTSHSDGMAAVAVTRGQLVGVDIERVRHIGDALELAQGLFTEAEATSLREVSETGRSTAFLTLWTRKESLVKALGGGLSIALDESDTLSVDDDGLRRPGRPFGDVPCAYADFVQPEGYVGAVTVESTGPPPQLSLVTAT